MRETDCSPENLERGIIVDPEDFHWIKDYLWTVQRYARRDDLGPLHRLIMGLTKEDSAFVDHINGNKLDNRHSNLRICTIAENVRNRKKSIRSKHKYKGIGVNNTHSSEKRLPRYFAKVLINGKKYKSRSFLTQEDAAKAYDELAIKYHGKFASTNKMLGLLVYE